MASEEDNQHNDVVAIELPAPAGWSKKFTPKKGGTPQKSDIIFISPTGEEIKSKKQLDQYLKSHPGGPAASEFEWGVGDTPRRSARLSEKSKTVVAPASSSPKKKQKRSSTKQTQEKNNADVVEEEATGEKDASAEGTKGTLESSTVDAKEEAADKDAIIPEKPDNEDVEKKTDTEKPSNATTAEPDAKIEESKETSSVEPSAKAEEPKEESSEPEAKNEEAKEVTNGGGEEAPEGQVHSAVTEGLENSKEKEEAEEKAVEKEEKTSQEPTAGS